MKSVHAVFVILMMPFLNGKQLQNQRNLETENADNRVKRNIQEPGSPRDWQWYLKDTKISMGVESTWKAGYTGRGVLVAVVDDGVNMYHPDLRTNFRVDASYDIMMDRPINRHHNPGSHGTQCAGIIAGENNQRCGVGVAYNAKIAGIRLYDDVSRPTDLSAAKALSYKSQLIDIYSNSWGPGDMGWQVKGPGPLLSKVLEDGAKQGRGGRGSIFVFAAGNGGISGDSCAFSGYVNNIHTIAISGVNWDGSVPSYTEQCAAIMAVTYGKDSFTYRTDGNVKPPMITTEGRNGCTENFVGTSATTPMASAIIALALEANPNLTWRDVQHLIVRSSQPLNPPPVSRPSSQGRPKPSWKTNKANLSADSFYGFGLMNANLMTKYAQRWVEVPKQMSCEIKYLVSGSAWPIIPWTGRLKLTLSANEQNCGIRFLEHVQVKIDLTFPRRGYLVMSSESPGGTQSQLLYSRLLDSWIGKKNLTNWKVTSLHYWGENPIGDWYFTIRNSKPYRNSRNAPDFRRVRRRLWTGGIAINGNYSAWSQWSLCTRPCNGGWQNRSRECNNPSPSNGGNDCSKIGLAVEYRKCNSQNCSDAVPPVHGGYTLWSHWGECTKPCNGGTQTRSRTCTNPPPAYGGRGCFQQGLGRARDERRCNTHRRCPGHVFSLTLILYGTREDPLASNPHVDRGIKKVETVDIDQRKRDIPVHGGWSQWSYWRPCDRGCGGGIRTRFRSCNNPVPADGGRDCSGSNTQSRSCNRRPCPVHGGYAPWSTWGVCSKSCDRGSQHRHRTCTNPRPAHGGRDCSQQRGLGPNSESRHCSVHRCPAPATNASCENNHTDDNCKSLEIFCGTSEDVQKNCAKTCKKCPVNGGYSQWSSWSECNVTCGGGNQTRNRSCINPPPENGGAPCTGHSSQIRPCNTDECPVTDCLNLLFGDAYCNRHAIRWCRYQWFSKYCKKSCGLC